MNKIQKLFVITLVLLNVFFSFLLLSGDFGEYFFDYYYSEHGSSFLNGEDYAIIIISLLVIIICYLFGVMCYSACMKFNIKQCVFKNFKSSLMVFFVVLILQLSFLLFYFMTGYGRAGATDLVDSNLKYIFVIIPVDYIFLIYFTLETKLFYRNINSVLYLISSVLRGWAGGILFLFILKICEMYQNGALKARHFLYLLFVLAISPIVIFFKFYMRTFSADQAGNLDLDYLFFAFNNSIIEGGNFIYYIIDNVFVRLQLLKPLIDLAFYRDILVRAFEAGSYAPFYDEGFLQLILRRFPGYNERPSFSAYFTYVSEPNVLYLTDTWATQTSLFGWLYILDLGNSLIYIFYVASMLFLSTFLVRKYFQNMLSVQLNFILILLLLIPGWTGAFQTYIQAQLLFITIFYSKFKIL